MNEEELIGQLKKGDQKALKSIFEMYQNYVFTIARQMVKKKEVAEEITQDVFVKVYHKIDTYKYKAKFSTWLFTIVYRTALNYLEKKQILVAESDYMHPESQHTAITNILHNSHSLNKEQEVEESFEEDYQQQFIVYRAIDKLDIKQGVIISLFYLKEFSVNEIAEIMQLSVNTVKTHLFRGRENLKKHLLKNYTREDLI